MTRIGLEIGPETLRAVVLERGGPRTFEVAWDPAAPAAAVAALREALGPVRDLAVAVDPELLRVRRVDLPTLPVPERRRALELEPERHFAIAGEALAFSLPGNGDLVFAAPRDRLEEWLEALGTLGPVARIEPAEVALGRVLADAGSPHDTELIRHGANGGVAWASYREGRLHAARHLFGDLDAAADAIPDGAPVVVDPWPDGLPASLRDRARPLPELGGVPPAFAPALGAALADETAWEEGFVTESLARDVTRRRLLRATGAIAAVTLALLFAVASLDAYRARVETRLDARIATLGAEAAPVVELQAEAGALERSIADIEAVEANRVDLLATLRILTGLLPDDTWLRSVQVAGPEWQIEGSGADAAALVPLLEGHASFEDVRFLAATSRIQRDNTSYDAFSLAFRTTPSAD
jgi:Tfp pilus assembly protein PilN